MKRYIRESPSVKKIEEAWKSLILTYGLDRKEWLQGLYNIQESWILVYNRYSFFVGMNTTQRSESINEIFNSFVNSRTTLQDFVVKFAKTMDNRFMKERKVDFDSLKPKMTTSATLSLGKNCSHKINL